MTTGEGMQSISGPRFCTILIALCLASAIPTSAHAPYEHPVRTFTDRDGRSLVLSKSYIDGIFFTDPVKLVVRDADDRTVAETEYGRDLSVICWGSRPCLIYRYDGVASVLPTNSWRLEGGQLHETRSAGWMALGVAAPLWDHAGDYLFSFVSLGVALLGLWLLYGCRSSWRRIVLLSLAGMGTVLYLGLWLYWIVLLSYLSLPLVVFACATGSAFLLLAYRGALRVGVPASSLLRLARALALVVVAAAALGVAALIVLAARSRFYSSSIAFEEPPVQQPLAKVRITRVRGVTHEIFATVAPGVRLEDAVNLDLFAGFDADMTREGAEQRLGPPSGRWTDPAYKVQSSYYDRPSGRVSLVREGASDWWTIGHPSACTHDYVFRDPRLRNQILQWLPPQDAVQVHVLRNVGWGGLTVFLSRSSCTHLVLTARDGDPDSR